MDEHTKRNRIHSDGADDSRDMDTFKTSEPLNLKEGDKVSILWWLCEYLSPENEEKRKADRSEFAKLGIKSVPISEFINYHLTNKNMNGYKELPQKARMCIMTFYYTLHAKRIDEAQKKLKLLEGNKEKIDEILSEFPFIHVGYTIPRTETSLARMICEKQEGAEYTVSVMMDELGEYYYNKNK